MQQHYDLYMLYYLKLNVKIEPLIWQWYAWPYLISPATAACNIVDRHVQIMESYIGMPQIHALAVKNPELLGGPYADLDGEYVEEVEELLNKTKEECSELIKLSDSLKEVDRMLQNKCQGGSMESLYGLIPDNLKGFVELVYDLNNQPSVRLIEGLMYKRFDTSLGQSIALSFIESDERPFVLSTPHIERSNELIIRLPFADKKIDDLVKLRAQPQTLETIHSMFNVSEDKKDLFNSFLTNVEPAKSESNEYSGESVRIRYFGHACILLQTRDVSILLDPVLSYDFGSEVSRFSFKDLPEQIDYVLITHNHQDHVLIETLLQIRHKVKNIVFARNNKGFLADPSLKLIFQQLGFNSLIALDDFESLPIVDGEIIGLPFFGEHSDLNIQSKLAYFINLKGKKIIAAADSNNIEPKLYDHIFSHIGAIDILFVGMECDGAPLTWLYGPLLSNEMDKEHDNSRTLSGSNFEKAWLLAKQSQCKHAYVYAMGQEPWLNYIMALKYTKDSIQITESDKFIEACNENNIVTERLFGKKEWII